jgi:hypothetical protein
MSPRGFFSKESIHPHFTTEEYKNSDQYQKDIDSYIAMENRIKAWFGYPRFLWYKGLTALGILAKPEDNKDK